VRIAVRREYDEVLHFVIITAKLSRRDRKTGAYMVVETPVSDTITSCLAGFQTCRQLNIHIHIEKLEKGVSE
jgi:hypothetical protein